MVADRLTLFSPCVPTTLVTDTCAFKVMKRVRAITFSTQGVGQCADTEHSRWQENLIPAFQVPVRLVVDFAVADECAVLAHAQVLAHRLCSDIPVRTSRSYASTSQRRRRMLHVCVDSSHHDVSTRGLLDTFCPELALCCAQNIAIGRECTYQLHADTFICTFNGLSWVSNALFKSVVEDVTFVSASRPC